MKVKSKISYLGERNSILPGQMAEQLSVEVDVKNFTEYGGGGVHTDKPQYLSWIFVFWHFKKIKTTYFKGKIGRHFFA